MIDLKTDHLTDQQLLAEYYREGLGTLAAELRALHLDDCAQCRIRYDAWQQDLASVDEMDAPARGPEYGERVWRAIEPHLRRPRFLWRWAAAAGLAAALALSVFAGWRYTHKPDDSQASERVLAVAVGDYLDRSQAVLLELANAQPDMPLDISAEQLRAVDLVTENRLYRQTALYTGQTGMAGALEELERVLLDITHAPAELSAEEAERLRQRLDAQGILFKLRVLGANVRSL